MLLSSPGTGGALELPGKGHGELCGLVWSISIWLPLGWSSAWGRRGSLVPTTGCWDRVTGRHRCGERARRGDRNM